MKKNPTAEKSLKQHNLKYIASTLIVDVLVLTGTFAAGVSKHIDVAVFVGVAKSAALLTVATVAALILANLLPSQTKVFLVFWRWRDALPGSRAFTQVAPADPRIDLVKLQSRIGDLPTEPANQNALWYKLMKVHEADPAISDAHQMYLLFRDLAAVSVILLAVVSISTAALPQLHGAWAPTAMLAGQYVLCAIAGRNTATRLVANVLAVEAAAEPIEPIKPARRPRKTKADDGANNGDEH